MIALLLRLGVVVNIRISLQYGAPNRYTHPIIQSNLYRRTSFLVNTVFNSEHLHPHIVDFDSNAFDVLFDNCANHTVSPVKSDFYYLEESDGVLTGIGKAPIKG